MRMVVQAMPTHMSHRVDHRSDTQPNAGCIMDEEMFERAAATPTWE